MLAQGGDGLRVSQLETQQILNHAVEIVQVRNRLVSILFISPLDRRFRGTV
jgi:hypothetical protein